MSGRQAFFYETPHELVGDSADHLRASRVKGHHGTGSGTRHGTAECPLLFCEQHGKPHTARACGGERTRNASSRYDAIEIIYIVHISAPRIYFMPELTIAFVIFL